MTKSDLIERAREPRACECGKLTMFFGNCMYCGAEQPEAITMVLQEAVNDKKIHYKILYCPNITQEYYATLTYMNTPVLIKPIAESKMVKELREEIKTTDEILNDVLRDS